MKPKRLHVPSPVHHKASGKDLLFLRGADGKRRTIYLGDHGSPEAERRYRAVLADHLSGKAVETSAKPKPVASEWPDIAQLCAAFLLHAGRYYVDENGVPSGEVVAAKYAFAELLRLYRDMPTDRITIRDLLVVRQALIDRRVVEGAGRKCPNGLSRRTINDRMYRVKRLFRWGVEQGLVPGPTWHELSALSGLPKGRCRVRDNPPVEAVPWPLVEETLPHLVPTVRAAVLTQWWTGMRPAELLGMTKRQIDMSGDVWLYRPAKHKGSWRGRERLIAIGPRAQELLRPFLSLAPDAPLFSPRAAWDEFRATKRAGRQTKETKQQRDRDAKADQAEPVAEFFDVDSYRRAITRACDAAEVPHWSPHRLRHAAGTRIAASEGIEVARATLGHSDVATTRRYAHGADAELAKRTAERLG
jgi:integrase